MGGSKIYVSTQLRTRDPENDTSIPTPVTSSPSTPTSLHSFKRKPEEDPPYLDLSGGILAHKYPRLERFDSCHSRRSPESLQTPQSSESLLNSPSQARHLASPMSFIVQPFNFMLGKITAFAGELWNQFKALPTPSEDSTFPTETESTAEPTQEPTPETTPEPTLESISESKPVTTVPPLKSAVSAVSTTSLPAAGARPKNTSRDTQNTKDVYWRLAKTLARRDATPRKRLLDRQFPAEARNREQARRANRAKISHLIGSPLTSSRVRGDELRRSRRQRPSRTAQFEEAQKAAIRDDAGLEAYLTTIKGGKDEGFKSYEQISQERARREEEIQRLKQQKKEPIVKPLSEATLGKVRQVIVDRDRGKVIIENSKARVQLYSEDMWRLNPHPPMNHPIIDDDHKLWLNDSIIDLYLHMVAEKYNKRKEPKKAHAFGAFFWSQLLKHGPKKVEGLTRRSKVGGDNMLNLDFVFIPANFNGNHWTLGVVRPKEKRLEFYDSMRGGAAYRSEAFFRAMRDYLTNELKGKAKIDKPWDQWWGEWTEIFVKDCPSQSNMYDCGVFTCKHAEVLARGRELTFTQADMPTIRYRMVAELLAGELGVE